MSLHAVCAAVWRLPSQLCELWARAWKNCYCPAARGKVFELSQKGGEPRACPSYGGVWYKNLITMGIISWVHVLVLSTARIMHTEQIRVHPVHKIMWRFHNIYIMPDTALASTLQMHVNPFRFIGDVVKQKSCMCLLVCFASPGVFHTYFKNICSLPVFLFVFSCG